MALTMTRTRTRTQTALTKLVADIHGELGAVELLVAKMPEHIEVFSVRRRKLLADRDALYATIRQFDPALDPTVIGASDKWPRTCGARSSKKLERYLQRPAV